MANGVLKVRVGGSWIPILAGGGATVGGLVPHAPSHAIGGNDPVSVLSLAGYPGGTNQFLRSDGIFAVATAVPNIHHATHELGGSDTILGVAWLDRQNFFTQPQVIYAPAPVLTLTDTDNGADLKTWDINNSNPQGSLLLVAKLDNGVVQNTYEFKRDGSFLVPTDIYIGGDIIINNGATTINPDDILTHPGGYPDDPNLILNGDGQFVPFPPAAPHHVTHETGGSDAIVNLNTAVITSGVFPRLRLPPEIAYEDEPNVFNQTNTFANVYAISLNSGSPVMLFQETDQPVDKRIWGLIAENQNLGIHSIADNLQGQANPLLLNRDGSVIVGLDLTVNRSELIFGTLNVNGVTTLNSSVYIPNAYVYSSFPFGFKTGYTTAYTSTFGSNFLGSNLAFYGGWAKDDVNQLGSVLAFNQGGPNAFVFNTSLAGQPGSSTSIVARVDQDGRFFERRRAIPMGDWIAYTPAITADGASILSFDSLQFQYSLVGNSMFILFSVKNIRVSVDTAFIHFSLPYTPSSPLNPIMEAGVPVNYFNGSAWVTAVSFFHHGVTKLSCHAFFPAGQNLHIWGNGIVPIA